MDNTLQQAQEVRQSLEFNEKQVTGFSPAEMDELVTPIANRLDAMQRKLTGQTHQLHSIKGQLRLEKQADGSIELGFVDGPLDTTALLKLLYMSSSSTGHVSGIYEPAGSADKQTGIHYASDAHQRLKPLEAIGQTLAKAEASLEAKAQGFAR